MRANMGFKSTLFKFLGMNGDISLQTENKFYRVTGYDDAVLPTRKTARSAGYDLRAYESGILLPNQKCLIETGIKASVRAGEFIALYLRSSVGINNWVELSNGTGIIDGDYFNNIDNEGHIMIPLRNVGDKPFIWDANERIAQLVFTPFDITSDDVAKGVRVGGFGSTNK